jgi:catechol 2,3-dioxygenase-like lactoylglutathione lyase family enzyme
MSASVYHVQLNVSPASMTFYRALLRHLGYTLVNDGPTMFGATNGSTDLWITETDARYASRGFHRRAAGLNHIAFRVPSRADVDRFAQDFLAAHRIPALYGGPREYPEYRPGYYAVFFESCDRLKLEVVHIP